jgi:hypothetical protein
MSKTTFLSRVLSLCHSRAKRRIPDPAYFLSVMNVSHKLARSYSPLPKWERIEEPALSLPKGEGPNSARAPRALKGFCL